MPYWLFKFEAVANLYEILEIRDRASSAEVKRAYRQLVKQYHPDINPEPMALAKMVEITNAYEVLSDPERKNEYDIAYFEPENYTYQQRTPSPEEEARKAYKERKAYEERERSNQLYSLKVKFYHAQRLSCLGFLLVGILFSIDFFYTPHLDIIETEKVILELNNSDNYFSVITTSYGEVIESERGLYDHFDQIKIPDLRIYYSSVFQLPSEIGVPYKGQILKYKIYGNLHEFENLLTYLLLFISLIIIKQKQYTDWALTLAIIPFFITIFLVLAV